MKKILVLTASTFMAMALAAPLSAQQGGRGVHFLENWDLNSDGKVTLEEVSTRRSDVFATFDANEDGALDANEYKKFDDTRAEHQADNKGRGGGYGRGAKAMTMKFNDSNKDGKVTKAEFLQSAKPFLELMDRDSDGTITQADFGRR